MANAISITGEDVMRVHYMTSDELVVELAHTRILKASAKTELTKRLTQAAENFLECEFQRRGWAIREDWVLAGPRSAELAIQLMHVCKYVASDSHRHRDAVRAEAAKLREALRAQFIGYIANCFERGGSLQELDRAFWWHASIEAKEILPAAYVRRDEPRKQELADWLELQIRLLTAPVPDLTLDSGTE